MGENSSAGGGLVRRIGFGHGVALYVSAILGAGVLVLPGQVASMAGPASLVSWGFACSIGVSLAFMFSSLATRYPDAGGVSTYVREAFGPVPGGVTGWLYFVAGSVGQTVVPLTGGYYLCAALGINPGWEYLIALAILAVAVGANLVGVTVSARMQLALACGVALSLLLTILVTLPLMNPGRLTPFAPHGPVPVGRGVVVLFFAFAGWEAVAHLAGEFRDPDRDLPRAVAVTSVIVTVAYLGTAASVVLTGTYGTEATDRVAIGRLLQSVFGGDASLVAAMIALIISLGTTNAFVAGVSRLGYSLAQEGWLPAPVSRVSRAGVPTGGVTAVAAIAVTGLATGWIRGWGTETLVVVPSTLVVAVYLLAAAAGLRLLTGGGKICAGLTLVMTCSILPTALEHAAIAVAAVILSLLARRLFRRTAAVEVRPAEPRPGPGRAPSARR